MQPAAHLVAQLSSEAKPWTSSVTSSVLAVALYVAGTNIEPWPSAVVSSLHKQTA